MQVFCCFRYDFVPVDGKDVVNNGLVTMAKVEKYINVHLSSLKRRIVVN